MRGVFADAQGATAGISSIDAKSTKATNTTTAAGSQADSRLFHWLRIAERSPGIVSEWSIFTVFVEEACEQVNAIPDSYVLVILAFLRMCFVSTFYI